MNTVTVNGSSGCNSWTNFAAFRIGETTTYCLIFVVSLLGNSFIGIIVYRTQAMRKPINFFIVNMAMSDLLLPIFQFPYYFTLMYTDSWLIGGPLGQALCKLVYFSPKVSFGVSIQSLILVTVDRFGAVVFPLRSPLIRSKLCPFFILATWIVAMAIFSPFLAASMVVEYHGQLVCELQWNDAFGEFSSYKNYLLSVFVVLFYIPFLLLTIIYSIIFFKLKAQKIPGEQSANAEAQRAKRNRNVLKMSIAIVVAFAICWLPWSIILLVDFFVWGRFHCGLANVSVILYFVYCANCAMNPCICFMFSGNYRQGLKKLLNCCN